MNQAEAIITFVKTAGRRLSQTPDFEQYHARELRQVNDLLRRFEIAAVAGVLDDQPELHVTMSKVRRELDSWLPDLRMAAQCERESNGL